MHVLGLYRVWEAQEAHPSEVAGAPRAGGIDDLAGSGRCVDSDLDGLPPRERPRAGSRRAMVVGKTHPPTTRSAQEDTP
jgi:hypothetical protein